MNKFRILFVHNFRTNFVAIDIELLRENYDVTECFVSSRFINPLALWRQVARHDVVVGWFASWHTFLPLLLARVLHKPSLLVIGGYDLANQPEAGYGHQRGGFKKYLSRLNMHLARRLVTNAQYSRYEAERNAGIAPERVAVVYHGVPDVFGEINNTPRARTALTVGNVSQANLLRKGHELFVRAAALLPDVEFVLAGEWKDSAIEHLREIATPNVNFTGWIDDAELTRLYQQASVYVQVSSHEGFGMSLAEAMLAGCIPIVTRIGAIPEVVGTCGVYVAPHAQAVAEAINDAMVASYDQRRAARCRIKKEFMPDKRRMLLEHIISEMVNKK